MSNIKELAPGLIELETDKRIDELRRDDDVLAVYEVEDTYKAIVDMSDFMGDEINYIH